IVVEVYRVHVAAFLHRPVLCLETHRDDLSGFGVITKAGRVRHADELIADRVSGHFQWLGHHRAQLVDVGAVGDDHELAVVEFVRSRRIGGIVQRHSERLAANLGKLHRSDLLETMLCEILFAAVACQIEGEEAVLAIGPFQHLRVAERAHRSVVARIPVLLHHPPRKLVILGGPLVILGPIDQLNDVVDFLVRFCGEHLRLGSLQQILGHLGQQLGDRTAKKLLLLELVRRHPGAAGQTDILLARLALEQIAWNSPRALQRSSWKAIVSFLGEVSSTHCSGVLETRPPSQYCSPSISVAGSPGGSEPLAITCSGPIWWVVLSKQTKLPVRTLTAPTLKRIRPSLIRSKSTRPSSVAFSGVAS